MEKVTIYKNKAEAFKCQLSIEGVDPEDIKVRMILEFADNHSLLFNGVIDEDGNCSIKIPKLKDAPKSNAKLLVEAIADGSHFQLYEATAELKNSVDIKIKSEATMTEDVEPGTSAKTTGFKFEKVESSVDTTFSLPTRRNRKI